MISSDKEYSFNGERIDFYGCQRRKMKYLASFYQIKRETTLSMIWMFFRLRKANVWLRKKSQERVEVNANKEMIDKRDEISFKQT